VLDVILGPESDLHVGVKGALVDAPPEGVTYHVRQARHVFVFPDAAPEHATPFTALHWGELVEFDGGDAVVHTSRWPVLNCAGWVTDTDDFGYPALAGRCALNPELGRVFRSEWTPEHAHHIRSRFSNMLAAYAHPSCVAVMFRSVAAAEAAARWAAELGEARHRDAFLAKIQIMYPAVPPAPPRRVAEKWDRDSPFQVLFCGRDFQTKNGALALDVFDRLSRRWPKVDFVYVGKVPVEIEARLSEPACRIRHHPDLERAAVLDVLGDSHVLFHPSRFESLGMILLEAASRGAAIVTGSGAGMSHTPGLLGAGALYVDRDRTPPHDEPRLFETALDTLIAAPARARAMGEANYRASVSGPLSSGRRDTILQRTYALAAARRGDRLTLDALPRLDRSRLGRLRTPEVWVAHGVMRRSLGVDRARVEI
jgi:hypothetical protein